MVLIVLSSWLSILFLSHFLPYRDTDKKSLKKKARERIIPNTRVNKFVNQKFFPQVFRYSETMDSVIIFWSLVFLSLIMCMVCSWLWNKDNKTKLVFVWVSTYKFMQKVHFLWTKIYMRQPKTLWFSMYPFLINAAFSVLCLFDSKVGENVSYDMLYT